ncbi:DNA fragmentation factor subunit beta isoform X3 [Lemur catta]|uniref:DNA fragmentation factor subunit beta isoform X3 n=1 Tax=Lemur catta TaxID=9447 RepID=UPI001E268385|nr:DNA fragmentation factor subunit beta isoform X3 [Lemur catta]
MLQKAKSVKMRALRSPRKFGVAGRSCQELLRKGCLRFQLPVRSSWLCLYEDGTELTEDYFPSIPDNAELVLLTSGQTWQGYVSDIGHFLSVFHEPHAEIIQAARQLLSGEQAPLRQKLLADLLQNVSQNIEAETRAEDPPWFEGLESRFQSKSSYLRYSCESRIRGYLRENRKEAHHCPHAGQSRQGTRRKRSRLGVFLQPAFHLREPQARAHRLPQENYPQARLRSRQDLQTPDRAAEEAAGSQVPVMPRTACSGGASCVRGILTGANFFFLFWSLQYFLEKNLKKNISYNSDFHIYLNLFSVPFESPTSRGRL